MAEKAGDILIERLKLLLGCKNYAGLSHCLGLDRRIFSRARQTGRLPEELRAKLLEHGLNPEWVEQEAGYKYLTGEEGVESKAFLREEPLHYVLKRALREFTEAENTTDSKLRQ